MIGFVTLAQIRIAYMVAFDAALPGDLPFRDAANAVVESIGAKKAKRLFERAQDALSANPGAPYEDLADAVRAARAAAIAARAA